MILIKMNKKEIMVLHSKEKELFAELIAIVTKLRSPEGCLWDRKQTLESMIPNIIGVLGGPQVFGVPAARIDLLEEVERGLPRQAR